MSTKTDTAKHRIPSLARWRILIWGLGIGMLYGLFVAADFFGTSIRAIDGKVVSADAVKRKYGEICAIAVDTSLGEILVETPLPCSYSSAGNADVQIFARSGRFSGSNIAIYNSIRPKYYSTHLNRPDFTSEYKNYIPYNFGKSHPFELPGEMKNHN